MHSLCFESKIEIIFKEIGVIAITGLPLQISNTVKFQTAIIFWGETGVVEEAEGLIVGIATDIAIARVRTTLIETNGQAVYQDVKRPYQELQKTCRRRI